MAVDMTRIGAVEVRCWRSFVDGDDKPVGVEFNAVRGWADMPAFQQTLTWTANSYSLRLDLPDAVADALETALRKARIARETAVLAEPGPPVDQASIPTEVIPSPALRQVVDDGRAWLDSHPVDGTPSYCSAAAAVAEGRVSP